MNKADGARLRGPILIAALFATGCAAAQDTVTTGPSPSEAEARASGDAADAHALVQDTLTTEQEAALAAAAARRAEEDALRHAEIERELHSSLGSDPIGIARMADRRRPPELPLVLNDRVEAWIHYFQEVIPQRFALYLQRSGQYEAMIRQKLGRAGMPEELLYLALIESGMNPRAYSRARAAGLWQFISSTARLYDLEVSFWVDDRRDPPKATDAAIRYLADLYEEFGSWYLAAAAYNGGPGRVRRGLARAGVETFWDLADSRLLRSETRNYVPKLIAAALIARDPDAYGFGHVVPDTPIEYDLVEVPDATTFDVLAEAAGTDEETIRSLNPNFPRRVTPPDRVVQLRVPVGVGATFTENYAQIPPSERVTWLVHTVTRGQTLGHIAARYGTSVTALRAANGNVNPRRLRIGQQLIVPRSGTAPVARASSSTHTAPATAAEGPVTIVVRRGDTLWAIARRYEVSTRDIMAWNNLRSTVIKPGDRLQIRR